MTGMTGNSIIKELLYNSHRRIESQVQHRTAIPSAGVA